jgi:hypothetical protein
MAGDETRAQRLADDLAKRFPENTILQFNTLPLVHAQLALNRNDASKTIELLQTAAPTEIGLGLLYPAYLRGKAYLAAHQGSTAGVPENP